MDDTRYAIHHLGARWGAGEFPEISAFADDLFHVLYEADVDGLTEPAQNTVVVPACLAGQRGQRTLNITFNPGGTSLLDPADGNVSGLYRPMIGVDFDLDRGLDVIERRRLDVDTLDAVIAARNLPAPDFLSIDTQATEFEILASAPDALASACGLIVEVEFIEMYHGQKRFQDVLDLLDHAGFAFTRFMRLGELSGPRQPIGLRGRGRQIWADALFLRSPDVIPLPAARVLKLAFTALIFGHVEFALAWLDRVAPDEPMLASSSRRYAALLRDVKRTAAGGPTPPLLSRVLPREQIKSFSTSAPNGWAALFDLAQFRNDPSYVKQIEKMMHAETTPFEEVLQAYGLEDVAFEVAAARRATAHALRDTLAR